MKIKNLNNATTYIESKDVKLLIDRLLVGNLYNNAWSPYEDDIHFLNSLRLPMFLYLISIKIIGISTL